MSIFSLYFRPLHIAAAQENLVMVQKLLYLMSFTRVPIDTTNNLKQVNKLYFSQVIFVII